MHAALGIFKLIDPKRPQMHLTCGRSRDYYAFFATEYVQTIHTSSIAAIASGFK